MSRQGLNPGQKAAVSSTARRIVVSAGAGSGKTRVLAERFVDVVVRGEAEGETSPMRSVLLITFTDKAAGELVERVRGVLLGRGRADLAREIDGAWISTIHGFCSRIVRRHALELGVDPGFAVLAEPRVGLIRRAAFERAAVGLLHEGRIGELVELHGPEALRATVLASYDRVRSMGADTSQVLPCASPDLAAALKGVPQAMRSAVEGLRSLDTTKKTIAANIEKYLQCLAVAEELTSRPPDEEAAIAAAGLTAFLGGLQGGEPTREVVRSANEAIVVAAQAGVDTIAAAHAEAWLALVRAHAREYEEAKAEIGGLDFEDLQLLARRLWVERPRSAERYQSQFREVMIDEAQDTNALQMDAILPLACRRLCVVGDVQQSIYGFRDADVGLFTEQRRAAEASEDGEACELTVNYRSHPDLLPTLNALFGSETYFGKEYLRLEDAGARESGVSWPAGVPRAEAILVDKAGWGDLHWRDAEARALAIRLRGLVDEGRMVPDDIVVLLRAASSMPNYVDALKDAGFEVHSQDVGGFHDTPEAADVRALLRVLANPLDDEGVLCLLAGGLGGVSDDGLLALTARRGGSGVWAAIPSCVEEGLISRDAERAALVRDTVELLRERQGRMRLADAILHAVAALGPGGGALSRRGALGNLRKAARLAAEFERVTPADPAAFLRHLADRESYVRREAPSSSGVEGAGAVRVMTIHGAKGLEFPVVVVADLGRGRPAARDPFMVTKGGVPPVAVARVAKALCSKGTPDASAWRRALDDEERLDDEESRRVFYVACTRAEQVLILTGATSVDKEPGGGLPVDLLRAAIAEAGGAGVPGLAVTQVRAEDEDGHAAPTLARPGVAPVEGRDPVCWAVLRPAQPIAPPTETSYTALDLYERCGYRFFAERMLGVGSADVLGDTDPRALGSALHGALKTLADGRKADSERLRALAAAHRLGPDGSERLASAVDAFTASPSGALLMSGRAEVPFAVEVEGGIVAGSMDLVVRDGDVATVLDYKTGLASTAQDARYRAQAEIYALALLEVGCERVEVRFVRVEDGCHETSFAFSATDRARIGSRVEDAFARMGAGEFARREAFDAGVCPDCPVSGGLCPVTHPGRKRSAGG